MFPREREFCFQNDPLRRWNKNINQRVSNGIYRSPEVSRKVVFPHCSIHCRWVHCLGQGGFHEVQEPPCDCADCPRRGSVHRLIASSGGAFQTCARRQEGPVCGG